MKQIAILFAAIIGILPVVRGEQSPPPALMASAHPARLYLAMQSSR